MYLFTVYDGALFIIVQYYKSYNTLVFKCLVLQWAVHLIKCKAMKKYNPSNKLTIRCKNNTTIQEGIICKICTVCEISPVEINALFKFSVRPAHSFFLFKINCSNPIIFSLNSAASPRYAGNSVVTLSQRTLQGMLETLQ